jgi:regulator of telomere elongation helicase 1
MHTGNSPTNHKHTKTQPHKRKQTKGIALHRLLARRVRSLVLTSGTLSPLESFAAELQVGFRHSLANPHIVGAGQVWVGVVPAGPTGAALNSSYATRSSPRYREDLGHAIANFARVVPDGLLVFFPSYAVLTDTLAAWKQPPGARACVKGPAGRLCGWVFCMCNFNKGEPMT